MLYVKASDLTVEKFPYTLQDLRNDNPNASIPRDNLNYAFLQGGALPVEDLAQPSVSLGQIAVRDAEPIIDEIENTWSWGWSVVAAPRPTAANVKAEAIRRMEAGFSVTRNSTTFTFDSDQAEREEIQLLAAEAIRYVQEGGLATDSAWFNGGTINVQTSDGQSFQVNPRQMANLGKALLEHVRGYRQAARVLISTDPIPYDYATNAAYWPT